MKLPALADIQAELSKRRMLKSQLAFTTAMFEPVTGQKFTVGPPHVLMCDALDRVMSGKINRLIINIPPGYGKAIDCDTPMWTPNGFKKARDIVVGDSVLGSNGMWTKVVGVHPQGVKDAYKVTFSDGAYIVACSEHLWSVRNRDVVQSRGWKSPWRTMKTAEIAANMHEADGRKKWRIPVVNDMNDVDAELPIDPYILGCWLGDGHSNGCAITSMDDEIVEAFSEYDPKPYTHQSGGKATVYGLRNGFVTKIRSLGLRNNKHIPLVYKLASHRQRVALIQGLFDTDGWVGRANGQQGIASSYQKLNDDIRFVLNSIGAVWTGFESQPKVGKLSYKTFVSMPVGDVAFRLKRKADLVRPRREHNTPRRFFKSIERVEDREMVCFTVDADDHLFCAGKDLIVTHNTQLAVIDFMARGLAINPAARFIHATYSQSLALDNSSKVRDLVRSEAFQALWPVKIKEDTSAKGLWRTSEGGGIRAASSGEPITGFRAGHLQADGEAWRATGALIIDDPVKPDDARSETTRKFINERWQNTFRSRLADESIPVIVIMQRLHIDDFVAHVLATSGEKWHVLKLPILIDGECEPISENAIMIPHGLPNGPLWDKKHTLEQINILKLSPGVFAGQYMQEPVTDGGNLFKTGDLQSYEELPPLAWRAIYADTAQKTGERNDYTVFQHWGRSKDGRAYLIDQVRGKFEAPELEAAALALWSKAKAMDAERYGSLRKMAIEDKVSGTGLIQSLKRKAIPVMPITRTKDKYTRALDAVPYVATGLVYIPSQASWRKDFIAELAAFPEGKNDDQVDPLIDAVVEMCGGGIYTLDNL